MKTLIFSAALLLFACKTGSDSTRSGFLDTKTVITNAYELRLADEEVALLILFPGGGTTSKAILEDFDVAGPAADKDVSVLFMNFNRHLWLDDQDAETLARKVKQILDENDTGGKQIVIGGMSIGGTVALTLANYLLKSDSAVKPDKVFVVDSPIDLNALYESSVKDVARADFTEERLEEPRFIIEYLDDAFGGPDSILINAQKVSPITRRVAATHNIQALKETNLRLYTEPDTLWHLNVRQTDFESTNAYTLQRAAEDLRAQGFTKVELIQTTNKGYRSNGERHPHSWSIVDVDRLLQWILL